LPRSTTTRVSSGWDASISILLDIFDSHWGRSTGAHARNRRRSTPGKGSGPIVVDGMGRVFARAFRPGQSSSVR
jgi:hypothetical protein